MQGVGFTENITVLTGEQVSPNLEQALVPKKKNKAVCAEGMYHFPRAEQNPCP